MSERVEIPELGTVGMARYVWRQLTSMRTALILLMMLGIAAIPGSLVPQRITNAIGVRDLYASDPNLAKWYDRFYLFDVYGSPWFSAIYILLFISLIGCVLPRTLEHFKAMRAEPPATPRNLSRLEFHHQFTSDTDALPAALTWYYTVSNTITLILQIIIQKYIIDHDKILFQINENRKKPVKKSKMQERIEAMQESQKKLQQLKNKNSK